MQPKNGIFRQEILIEYQGKTRLDEPVTTGMRLFFFIGICLQLTETLCYISNYTYIHNHDSTMAKQRVISSEMFQKRKRQNAISEATQIYTFVVEISFLLVMTLLSTLGQRLSYANTMEWLTLLKLMEPAIVSTIHVLASTEIRNTAFRTFKLKVK